VARKVFYVFILASLFFHASIISAPAHDHDDRHKSRCNREHHESRPSGPKKKPHGKLPVIHFAAKPETIIEAGQSVTLSWKICQADKVSIDHGIGNVPKQGSIQVRPKENTIYTLTAKSCKKSVSSQVFIQVSRPLTVRILHPQDESQLDGGHVAVSGSVSLPDARVNVNGVPALVSGDFFIAENLSLAAGRNILTATALSAPVSISSPINFICSRLFRTQRAGASRDKPR
jgi:hypothetical protein